MAKSKHSNINHSYCVILKRIKKTFTDNNFDCMKVVAALKFISLTISIQFTKSLFASLRSFVFFPFHQTVYLYGLGFGQWRRGLAMECVLEDGEVEQGEGNGRNRKSKFILLYYRVLCSIGLEKKKWEFLFSLFPYRGKPFQRNILFFFFFFFFWREFQPMASAPDNSFLSSDQDTNPFLV